MGAARTARAATAAQQGQLLCLSLGMPSQGLEAGGTGGPSLGAQTHLLGRHGVQAQQLGAALGGQGRQDGRKLVCGQHHGDAGVTQHVAQLRWRVRQRQGHGHGAGQPGAPEGSHILGPGRGHDAHAWASHHA